MKGVPGGDGGGVVIGEIIYIHCIHALNYQRINTKFKKFRWNGHQEEFHINKFKYNCNKFISKSSWTTWLGRFYLNFEVIVLQWSWWADIWLMKNNYSPCLLFIFFPQVSLISSAMAWKGRIWSLKILTFKYLHLQKSPGSLMTPIFPCYSTVSFHTLEVLENCDGASDSIRH